MRKFSILNFQFSNKKGFTLIELLIVIGVISTLMAVLLPRLSQFNRYQLLQDSTGELQTVIRTVQNNAISGVKCNTTVSNTVSASKWLLEFDGDQKHYQYASECAESSVTRDDPVRYKLPTGVTISNIELCTGSGCSACSITNTKIYFDNISGNITYADSACPMTSTTTKMIITVTSTSSGHLHVVIERGGSIFIDSAP